MNVVIRFIVFGETFLLSGKTIHNVLNLYLLYLSNIINIVDTTYVCIVYNYYIIINQIYVKRCNRINCEIWCVL